MFAALCLAGCQATPTLPPSSPVDMRACDAPSLIEDDRARVLQKAKAYLDATPRTIVSDYAPRSAGGPNDFYSEGDYWWPVTDEPDAPYQRRDGQTNPDNFTAHRLSMIRLSDIQGSLASAFILTDDPAYAEAALDHLRAWFMTPETRMTPALLYAQAIQGRHTGRSIGLIDTLHLVEVARAAKIFGQAGAIPDTDYAAIQGWFDSYATWMNTHPYGIGERDWHNNHAIAWGLQVAAFADLSGNTALRDQVRSAFKTDYLNQMNTDGGFPDELSRTKPYGYSLFVLDLMGGIAQILSTPEDDLWRFKTPDGRGLRRGLDFLAPYIRDKTAWPYGQDIAYWDDWPLRHPAFFLASPAFGDCTYAAIVRDRTRDSDVYEVTRNVPLRHPVIWLNQ